MIIVIAVFLLLVNVAWLAARAVGRRIQCGMAADRQDQRDHDEWVRIMKGEV
jgi:hypothetical protein